MISLKGMPAIRKNISHKFVKQTITKFPEIWKVLCDKDIDDDPRPQKQFDFLLLFPRLSPLKDTCVQSLLLLQCVGDSCHTNKTWERKPPCLLSVIFSYTSKTQLKDEKKQLGGVCCYYDLKRIN